ncbi:MAG: hypothetical protein V1802_03145 [Candidatus Aenigmatarchaeota archaeon]
MKIIYGTFFSGLVRGQILHTETGVSILDDSYECKFLYAQKHPDSLAGPIGEDLFNRMLQAKIGANQSLELPVDPKNKDSIMYTLRNIPVSDTALKKFGEITEYCTKNRKTMELTGNDRKWFMELVSEFPEYNKLRAMTFVPVEQKP